MSAPFKVGDLVRVRPEFVYACRRRGFKSLTGVIVDCRVLNGITRIKVERKTGLARKNVRSYLEGFNGRHCMWEVVPVGDLSLDYAANALARAVLAGDMVAAGPLADRVSELISEHGR